MKLAAGEDQCGLLWLRRRLNFADVKFKDAAPVALGAGLRHVKEVAEFAKELLADGLLRRSRAFPMRNEIISVPFRRDGRYVANDFPGKRKRRGSRGGSNPLPRPEPWAGNNADRPARPTAPIIIFLSFNSL